MSTQHMLYLVLQAVFSTFYSYLDNSFVHHLAVHVSCSENFRKIGKMLKLKFEYFMFEIDRLFLSCRLASNECIYGSTFKCGSRSIFIWTQ